LRGVAAMMVVFGHLHLAAGSPSVGIFDTTVQHLGSGVDLFFILSGFCLYWPLTRPGATFAVDQFFRCRARRILPPYYATICALLLLPGIIQPIAERAGFAVVAPAAFSWRQLWPHLLLIHTLFPDTFFGMDGPFWSLGVEMQFYLAFPLAVWLVLRYHWRGFVMMAFATVLYQLAIDVALHLAQPARYLASGNPTVDVKEMFFLGRWLEFGLGMATAVLVRRRSVVAVRRSVEYAALAGCAGLWLAVALFVDGAPDRWLLPISTPLYGLLFAVLLLLACTPGTLTGRLLSARWPVAIGTISYSLYLIHQPLVLALSPTIVGWQLGGLATLAATVGLGLPLVLGCAALWFALFERPFLPVRAISGAAAPAVDALATS
jgi:peptidoglycan/LPS O-acetylase OafA/YrhL